MLDRLMKLLWFLSMPRHAGAVHLKRATGSSQKLGRHRANLVC